MTNIPTELLRTLIAVVDLRSFTQAAHSLKVTQPAVSAQIRRLHTLLGGELFDKRAPGVTLTPKGEIVVNYARRLLSINDQILDLAAGKKTVDRLRIGIPIDYLEGAILTALAAFRARHPHLAVQVCADASTSLLRDLRRGEFDLVVAGMESAPGSGVRHTWIETNAWAAASPEMFAAEGPVPLAVLGENSMSRRLSVSALEQAGQRYEIAYVGGSFDGLVQAAATGYAVACWSKRMLQMTKLTVLDSAPPRFPRVADVHAGVFLREGADSPELDELADMIAKAVA